MKKTTLLVAVFFCHTVVFAQKEIKRTVGLSTTIGNADLGIQVPFWIGNSSVLAPAFEYSSITNSGFNLGFGIVSRNFFKGEKLRPYFGLKFLILMYNPPSSAGASANSTQDLVAGLAFGGEYFFDPQFSIGVEAQANYTTSDKYSNRFGIPDKSAINTATVVTANIYFGK